MTTVYHANEYDDYSGPDFHYSDEPGPHECRQGIAWKDHVVVLSLGQLEQLMEQAVQLDRQHQHFDVDKLLSDLSDR